MTTNYYWAQCKRNSKQTKEIKIKKGKEKGKEKKIVEKNVNVKMAVIAMKAMTRNIFSLE